MVDAIASLGDVSKPIVRGSNFLEIKVLCDLYIDPKTNLERYRGSLHFRISIK
jgi:hypothetical protein